MIETRKQVTGFEGLYEVSNLGRVKSISRRLRSGENKTRIAGEFIVKLHVNKRGYNDITLHNNRNRKHKRVCRLVAQEFISNIENKPEVNHKNGIRTDDRVENLERTTKSENMKHSFDVLGRIPTKPLLGRFGKLNHNSKKVYQYSKNLDLLKIRDSLADIKRELGYSFSNIGSCCRGNRKFANGYIWMYTKSDIEKNCNSNIPK